MKLKKLEIKSLYGIYNYNIDFNSDITFIYGKNGCGKTTVLNIIESIITGDLSIFYEIKFDNIILHYESEDKNKDKIEISFKGSKLKLNFENKNYYINKNSKIFNENKKIIDIWEDNDDFDYFLEKEELLLKKIKKIFNSIYLPLNRVNNKILLEDEYVERKYYRKLRRNREYAISKVEEIIFTVVSKINSEIIAESNNFRNEVLKSLINPNNKNLLNLEKERLNIPKIKEKYIELLEKLSMINEDEKKKYELFFDNVIEIENSKEQNNDTKKDTTNIEHIININEIYKMKQLVGLSEASDRKKEKKMEKLNTFLNIMNTFLEKSDDSKKLIINNKGYIFFETKHNSEKINIKYLSSGEKQLLTLFSYLLNMEDEVAGIFIVDEPEISLHMYWQKILAEKILEMKKNIQLIFATHSPEIIGKNQNKMFKLEKIYKESNVNE